MGEGVGDDKSGPSPHWRVTEALTGDCAQRNCGQIGRTEPSSRRQRRGRRTSPNRNPKAVVHNLVRKLLHAAAAPFGKASLRQFPEIGQTPFIGSPLHQKYVAALRFVR